MSAESPFTITRFEYERKHLYFLPDALFAELENSIPTYLVGSRGTGKTTLLKALTWSERLHNHSLQSQLNDEPFSAKYLGVYFKLPEIQLGLLDRWLADSDEGVHGSVLGLFFDLIWLELAVDGVAELVAEGKLSVSPTQEHQFVELLRQDIPLLFDRNFSTINRGTLKDLARILRERKRGLEVAALHRSHWDSVIDGYPLGQIGELGKAVSRRLATLCDGPDNSDERGWRFVICMDEGECLNPFQQLVINTLVRLAEWPAFPIIASVSLPDDVNTTLVPELTLQKADRQLKILDDMGRAEFKELAQGVANVRVRSVAENCVDAFDVQRILGPLSINRILEDILQNSVRPGAKLLLEQAGELTAHAFFQNGEALADVETEPSGPLPIYQTYLINKLHIPISTPGQPGWQRRRQDSAELRKRMVAAYLAICSEFGVEVRYASAEMLLEMSDRCMRDFLSQIEEVFRGSGKSLESFLKGDVSYAVQYSALKRASEIKRDSIPKSGVRAPLQTGRVVDGLARITAAIQRRGPDNRHLLSSERGIFVVQADSAAQSRFGADLLLLSDASDAGFLRLVNPEEPAWEVRVHTSLAAAYGFSYRGAYYKCRLSVEDLHRLANADDRTALDAVIASISSKIGGENLDDLPLFEGKASG